MTDFGRDLVDWLYYGDNLEILSRFISDSSVDLVYLDPPFNKNAAYSVIFRDESGRTSDAQIATLEDYWHWGPTPARHYEYLTNSAEHGGRVPGALSELIGALHSAIRPSPLLAYLVEMALRLVELHRVLKHTGTLYLHCDPTNSHYLKLVLDAVFGPTRFLNEITWKRTHSHGNVGRNFGAITDNLLVYTKTDKYTWNQPWAPLDSAYVAKFYRHADADGRRWRTVTLRNPAPRPNLQYPYLALNGVTYTPHPNGWAWTAERMRRADEAGKLVYPKRSDGALMMKQYLDESRGVRLQNLWDDIKPVGAHAAERLGYPTQKPIALLERIIETSTNPGDVVLDPFCGCGTAFEAAINTGRHRVGIDISDQSVRVHRQRLERRGLELQVFDWPTEMDGVRRMVESDRTRRRFEDWALSRLGLPVNRRGGDGGIDGKVTFTSRGKQLHIIVSVKSAKPRPSEIRDLRGVMQRDKAVMGLLFSLEEPSPFAWQEIHEAGTYRAPDGREYPKIVVHTVEELLVHGRLPDLPSKHGIQAPLWPIPASTRSVRVRSASVRLEGGGARRASSSAPAPSTFADALRQRDPAAVGHEPQESRELSATARVPKRVASR